MNGNDSHSHSHVPIPSSDEASTEPSDSSSSSSSSSSPSPSLAATIISRVQGLLSYLPLILSFILNGLHFSYIYTAIITLVVALVCLAFEYLLRRLGFVRVVPKQLTLGNLLLYALVLALALTVSAHTMQRWNGTIVTGGLLLMAAAGVAVKRPFALQYAQEKMPLRVYERAASIPSVLIISFRVTYIFIGVFALMFALALLIVLVQHCPDDNTNDNCTVAGSALLPLVIGISVPMIAVFLAGKLVAHFVPKWRAELEPTGQAEQRQRGTNDEQNVHQQLQQHQQHQQLQQHQQHQQLLASQWLINSDDDAL